MHSQFLTSHYTVAVYLSVILHLNQKLLLQKGKSFIQVQSSHDQGHPPSAFDMIDAEMDESIQSGINSLIPMEHSLSTSFIPSPSPISSNDELFFFVPPREAPPQKIYSVVS